MASRWSAPLSNDLDVMGRVCSALPWSMVDGMGAHHARHNVPAVGNGASFIPVPADPPPETSSLTVAGSVRCSTLGPRMRSPSLGGESYDR